MRITPELSLKLSIFLTGFSGIVAEYLLSTIASYLLGDSVFQWTIVISIMLLAMGLGARCSKSIKEDLLLDALLVIELMLSLLVSFCAFIAYSQAPYPNRLPFVIYFISFLIGFLIGTEIPIAVRINKSFEELRKNISSILEKDYLGALPGGILYGYVFLPHLGLIYTPSIIGMLNLSVAGLLFLGFKNRIKKFFLFPFGICFLIIVLFTVLAKPIFLYAEQRLYRDPIIFLKQTKYQKIVLTKWRNYYLLYLDGHLQLSSVDENRYHEALVHIPASLTNPKKVLIIGGGDGCALREVLKYPVSEVDLVDIDKDMIEFAKNNPIMQKINKRSLWDKRVKIFAQDGFIFVKKVKKLYDLVIIDLIDPRNPSSARLYSQEFYRNIYNILTPNGVMITQATSPFFARKAFCCILNTVKSAGFFAYPLRINIPSFGEWGFVLGIKHNVDIEKRIKTHFNENLTTYLTKKLAISCLYMEKNFSCKDIEVSTLLKPSVLKYYDDKMWEIW